MATERDRKFQATLDKCTKRIEKGDEFLNKQWLRIEAREDVVMQQTDKFASEVKKELSKVQREREKLRAWLVEVRPEYHAQINSAKELVEASMYRYRSFERAWKNRTGVFASGDQKPMQPEDREKLECCDQWANLLDAMRLHVETTEGEEVASSESAERRALGRKRKALERHVEKLEQVLRALENERLRPDDVAHAQDVVEYLVESDCADDELLHDLGVYDDLALGAKLDSSIGRLVHKPKAAPPCSSYSDSELPAAASTRQARDCTAFELQAPHKPHGVPALRARSVSNVRAARQPAAAGRIPHQTHHQTPTTAAPTATIRVIPLQRVAPEAEQQQQPTDATTQGASSASSVRVEGDNPEEARDVHTPGMEAVACAFVESSGSRGSQPFRGAYRHVRGMQIALDAEGLELPSDDVFLKLTPLKREASGDSGQELTMHASATSSDVERILAVQAHTSPCKQDEPDEHADSNYASASSESIASAPAAGVDASPSVGETSSGDSASCEHVCKNLTGAFRAAAEYVLAEDATPAACKSGATHQIDSHANVRRALRARRQVAPPKAEQDAAAADTAPAEAAVPSPICAPFSGGAPVAFSSTHQLPAFQQAEARNKDPRPEKGTVQAYRPVLGSLILPEDIEFFHKMNRENDALYAEWVAEAKIRREQVAAAAAAEPDALKVWQQSAQQRSANRARLETQSTSEEPVENDAENGASLTSSSKPLMAAFYLDASVAKQRNAKFQLEAMGFRYHTSLHTWFHRLKHPKSVTATSESGHVVFFNFCRPAIKHPLVQHGLAEPYPTLPDGKGGRVTPGSVMASLSAAEIVQRRAAAAEGWTFMQARDFEFEFRFLSPTT